MTTRLLLPVRIPEIGPSLGKIVVGSGRRPGGLELTEIRLQLATRVFDAAGEARRLGERDQRVAALAAVGRTAWLSAWEEAVNGATDLIVESTDARIQREARSVGMSRRKRQELLINPRERRTLHARLGSCAAPMVKALDRVESWGKRAAAGKSGDAMRGWQEALRTSARRLEGAWLALEDATAEECARWDAAVHRVSQWRRSQWPVYLVGAVGLSAAIWLGLVFGGYIGAPEWLSVFWNSAFLG